jgi:hypothetical protein
MSETPSPSIPSVMTIDLGRQSRRRIRQLRRGRGRLMRIVEDTLMEIQHESKELESNQPVVVHVQRRRRRRRRSRLSTLGYPGYLPMVSWF